MAETDITNLLLPYQKRTVMNPARFTWSNWSRQTGKSFAASLRRIVRGIRRRRNQIFLSAGATQSRELMMKARQHIEAMKLSFTQSEGEFHDPFANVTFKQMEIALPAFGIRIIGLPANPATARGFTGDVLLDEFAMHRLDRDIWASVFPTVLRGSGELDIASTPKGRQNMFYRLRENPQFAHSTVTIDDAISDGLDVDRQALYEAMGDDDLFRQEFLCEFVDEATAFLTYEMIGECEDVRADRTLDVNALCDRDGDVVVGVDIGRKRDLTVIWAFAVEGKTLTSLGLIELASMRFRSQFEMLSRVLSARCVRRCCIDATGIGAQMAEEAVETFGSHRAEACTFTAPFKAQIASAMRIKFTDQLIRIPVDDAIRNDLHSIRKTVTTAGNVRLDAPRERGSHADRFWAAALAIHAAGDAIVGPLECEIDDASWTRSLRGAGSRSKRLPPVIVSHANNRSGVFA